MEGTIQKGSAKKRNRWKRNMAMWGYLFIAPTVIGILVFSIGPMLFAFYMSLNNWDGMTEARFIGLQNFVNLFKNPTDFLIELRNTFVYAISVVPITIFLAIILANFLNSRIPARSFFRVLYFLPIVTMATAVTVVWRHSQMGLVNYLFRPFGLNPQWLGDPNWIMPALIIVAVWSGVGYATVMCLAGLQSIPTTYYEAAEIDGANAWHKFSRITVPLLSPTIFFLSITSLINAFKAFDNVFMLLGGSETAAGPTADAVKNMVFGIFQKGFKQLKMGYASSEAVVLFAIIMLVTAVQFGVQKKLVHYD